MLRLEDDKDKVIVDNPGSYQQLLNSHVQYCLSGSFSLISQSDSKVELKCQKCGFEIEYKFK